MERGKGVVDGDVRMKGVEVVFNEVGIRVKGEIVGGMGRLGEKREVKDVGEEVRGVKMYGNGVGGE
ncbi:hypothetical protein [Bacillus altitudinis]|uniref:hypothetical protein n=1 Tax=Bacillus altitudinis TaxID=293387 RepID=UPI00119D8E3C|nr:hypothetical protein [Bacillus altitudinis]